MAIAVFTNNNDSAIIITQSPYSNVSQILGFTDTVIGESYPNNYLNKFFRWSQDGHNFTDWISLTNYYLSNQSIDYTKPLFIHYKYEVGAIQAGNTMELTNITLTLQYNNNLIIDVNQIDINDTCPDCYSVLKADIIQCNDCDDIFQPYKLLTKSLPFYHLLVTTVNNIFGHCIKYYRGEPHTDGVDIFFREYNLYNKNSVKELKVLVPDNNFNTAFKFGPFDGFDFEDLELHIVKSEFEFHFGPNAIPKEKDTIYFPLLKRMYTVNSVNLADEVYALYSYYKVKLRKFEVSKQEILSDTIQTEFNNILSNNFDEKIKKESENIILPKQLKEHHIIDNVDFIRKSIHKNIEIQNTNLNNNWVIIGKYVYNFKTHYSDIGMQYKINLNINNNTKQGISFWIKYKQYNPLKKFNITNISVNPSTNTYNIDINDASLLNTNDYIIVNDSNYNKLYKITNITANTLETTIPVNTPPLNANLLSHIIPHYNIHNKIIIANNLLIIDGDIYDLNNILQENEWYCFLINFNNINNYTNIYIYTTTSTPSATPTTDTKLIKIYDYFIPKGYIININEPFIYGYNIYYTNFRYYNTILNEEQHNIILQQFLIKDATILNFADNAFPIIELAKLYNTR